MYQFDRLKLSAELFNIPDKKTRQKVLREFYDGYEAILDLPGSAFADELFEIYPDAKVCVGTPITCNNLKLTVRSSYYQ